MPYRQSKFSADIQSPTSVLKIDKAVKCTNITEEIHYNLLAHKPYGNTSNDQTGPSREFGRVAPILTHQHPAQLQVDVKQQCQAPQCETYELD